MRDLIDRLEAWQAVGLVSPEQADAIAAFEEAHAGTQGASGTGAPLDTEAPPSHAGSRRTVFAEAVGYVGAALAVGAVGMIVGQLWGELGTAPRLTLVVLLTTLLAGSGAALTRVDRAPLQRLASVLLTGAVGGVAWGTTIVAVDLTALEEAQVVLVGGLVPLSVALPLYLLRRRALHQLTVLVTVVVSAVAAMSLPAMTPEPMWYALLVIAIGGAWFALSAGGWLHPRTLGEVTGAVLVLLACQAPATERFPWLLVALGVAVAGGLVALAVVSDRTHHLAVGAIGLFVLVPRLVFELFGDAIGGPAAMLVVGLLLVLLAVGVGRARREVGGVRAEPTPPSRPGQPPAPPGDPTALPPPDLTDDDREEVRR
jgi:MFS family permease